MGRYNNGFLNYWIKNTANTEQIIANKLFIKEEYLGSLSENENGFDDAKCIFKVENINSKIIDKLSICSKKYGKGVLIIGDSHASSLFNMLSYINKNEFLVGITKNGCHLPEKLSICQYDEILDLLKNNKNIFNKTIYEKAYF
jgi:hypothetical protein